MNYNIKAKASRLGSRGRLVSREESPSFIEQDNG